MSSRLPKLFPFEQHTETRVETRERIIEYAALPQYRSAVVEELVLKGDFYRRPLRPEDLEFLPFGKPVRRNTYRRLPFFAAQRILFCINDTRTAVLPVPATAEKFAAFDAFYSEKVQVLGTSIQGFLEDFSFDFTSVDEPTADKAEIIAQLDGLLRDEGALWGKLARMIRSRNYLIDGMRCSLIQMWSLLDTKRVALARAAASGYFSWLPEELRPELSSEFPGDALLGDIARQCGVDGAAHSYWQFYLSTSLGSCNFLNALARRPDRALDLCGAAFAASAQWIAFGCLIGQVAGDFGYDDPKALSDLSDVTTVELVSRFEKMLTQVEEKFGTEGLLRVSRGLSAAVRLAECARDNLHDQLAWLSSAEEHLRLAHVITERINAECPDIDRETFVEPRDMCSTTHVHSDHRLVTVESGNMVFWGNPFMEVRLAPGDMILIPEGRLHGSSIESDECVYHQPIIPDEWITSLSNWARGANI
ncbi:hypothetical protein AD948_02760 [Acetobacter senegalensis]|uniref:Peptide synthetase n=1 Tax=Acetobacter senegalensis TaxID=446692 RepID=A0A149U6U2_9PROT|nr:cupin domain-containing protein [Acetobacter senegalensis]KXV61142.1 hypothetical protein AD948_02760 [Acetobacter senegalensis]